MILGNRFSLLAPIFELYAVVIADSYLMKLYSCYLGFKNM